MCKLRPIVIEQSGNEDLKSGVNLESLFSSSFSFVDGLSHLVLDRNVLSLIAGLLSCGRFDSDFAC